MGFRHLYDARNVLAFGLTWLCIGSIPLFPQSSDAGPAPVKAPPLPPTTQIKKTIVFIETDCLHDFSRDAANLTREKVLQMPQQQQQAILRQLSMLAMRLQGVKESSKKATPEETARLTSAPQQSALPEQLADEIEWRMRELIKITSFTDEEIASFPESEISLIPTDQVRGTAFLVGYPDDRIKRPPGEPEPRMFTYLVSNRHVVQPGIESGITCKVVSSYVLLNRKPDASHTSDFTETNRFDKLAHWTIPQDESVDLAVSPFGFNQDIYDHIVIPTSLFVTEDEIRDRKIVEGDPVLFAGLFIQTFDQVHTLEPIVRSGSLAMIPAGPLQTTIQNRLGRVYLAEAHAFHGNSGSPMFVDPNKFSGVLTTVPLLKLLGVISGEVYENSDLTFAVTASMSGNLAANSDVSMIVPSSEVKKILDSPKLSQLRDQIIEHLQ